MLNKKFLLLIFVISLFNYSFSQIIIKDSISLGGEFNRNNNLQYLSNTLNTVSYEVNVSISTTSAIHHPAPRKISVISDKVYIIEECSTTCGIPSNGFNKIVNSTVSSVSITYEGGQNAPSVNVRKVSSSNDVSTYEILFNYPSQLGYPPNLLAGSIIVTRQTTPLNPVYDSCFSQKDPRWKNNIYDHKSKTNIDTLVSCQLDNVV